MSHRIRCRAATDDYRSNRVSRQESWETRRRRAGSGLPGKKIPSAGITDPGCIDHSSARKHASPQDSLPARLNVSASVLKSVCACGREVSAVVDRVDSTDRILRRMNMIEPNRPEVVPDGLQRVIECFRDSTKVRSARALLRAKQKVAPQPLGRDLRSQVPTPDRDLEPE